jgi:hypothetical protein
LNGGKILKYTKIPETTFKNLQLNAGVLLSDFDPETAEVANEAIIGATTGGVNFTATPSFSDYGEDIDNCPKNMMELKKLDSWDISMSGTYVTVDVNAVKSLIGAGDVEGEKIVPRNDVLLSDFVDVWWVGDYSDQNGETNGGYVAIHMMNALSTGGFAIKSSDNGKGNFAFTYTAHYSMDAQETVPFEVYVKSGSAE